MGCLAESCDRKHYSKGWCQAHYDRNRDKPKSEWDTSPIRKWARQPKVCTVDECGGTTHAHGYCGMHLFRFKKYGDPGISGKINTGDSRIKMSSGYIKVYAPDNPMANCDNYVLEHRLVMSETLGRPLRSFENVHHINGVRWDNRIENLELWAEPQPSGQRVQDLAEWVIEAYPELVRELLHNAKSS